MKIALSRRSILGLLAAATLAPPAQVQAAGLPKVVVSKDPSCGCCGAWAEHLRRAGFPVEIVNMYSKPPSTFAEQCGRSMPLRNSIPAEPIGLLVR